MQNASCARFEAICRSDVAIAGGKGANLGDMVRARLPVPPGFVICAGAYREMMERSGLDEKVKELLSQLDFSNSGELRQAERTIRKMIEDVSISPDLRLAIFEHYRELGADAPVAVRSSATAEDLAGASFAGQQETILNVEGEQALLEAVRRCWSSLYTSQAVFYRRERGFGNVQVSMAVVVQRMINADKSGVIFTVDPVLHNHFQMLVEAVWGLGEGVVSGTITPDHYKIDRESYELVYRFVPEKKMMYCRGEECGCIETAVPPEKVSAQVLTEDELRQLVDLGSRVADHFDCPQDIEFAIEDGRIYLLQSRPITCL